METNRKELVEWVRGIYQNLDDADKRDALRFFPELAESEDERIRKSLIDNFKHYSCTSDGTPSYKVLAWLEKQKESLHIQETCKEKADSFTDDENERIRRFIQDRLTDRLWNPTWKFSRDDVLAYLERQKDLFKEGRGLYMYDGENVTLICASPVENPYDFAISQQEQKPVQFKDDELVEIIRGEFEGFRRLLKKKGIDYEPQRGYWEGFARLFDSCAKEYVKEQKPAEWSEEDEAHRKSIISTIEMCMNECSKGAKVILDCYESDIAWLKSLRPQSQWKPSEEQMEALHHYVETTTDGELDLLYNDLLKLK